MSIFRRVLPGVLFFLVPWPVLAQSAKTPPPLLSDLVDVSPDFRDYRNAYYLADSLSGFDPAAGTGSLTWQRHQLYPRIAFNNMEAVPNGVQTERMYKPIPFFLSSRGYGMFVHTSAPATFDMGASYHGSNALLLGDDELDLFVFLGTPKQVLDE